MKSIKNLSLRFTSIFFIILTFILLAGCASTTNTSKGSGLAPAAAPDLQSLPELTSVPAFSLPPEALPGIPYSCKLSDMPSSADLKKISVVSPKVYKWQPEEYFMDVYVYEKATEKYIACIKNCYQQSIAKWQWGNLGTVWAVWAKDDAVYLLSPSDYILCNKDGMQILTGYLAETAFSKARLNLGTPGWQPEGELCNLYLYSKKENKFVAYIKDCWRNSLWLGSKGWGGYVKNAYQIMDTNRQMYLIEASDYLICNEEGYEYINGWLAKTDFDKLMVSYGQLGWQPQGETRDYYLYSKKQKQIVTCIKDCWAQSFYTGLSGWNGNVKNAYRLITTDGKQYLAESSEYTVCNEQGYEYINGFQYKFDLINSNIFGTEISAKKGNVTVCENPVRELLYICKILSDCPSLNESYDDDSYLSDINSYFANFKNHEAVTFIKNNLVSFEKDDLQISRAVYSAGEQQLMSKESEVLPCGNEFSYKDFIELLGDFAKQSNFKKFFEAHKKYYEKHIIQNGFDAFEGVQKWNDGYLKQDAKIKYKICMHRGEWCDVNYNNQSSEMIINLATRAENDSIGLAHELSHPIVNPVVEKLYGSVLRPFMDSYFIKNLNTTATYYYPDALSYWCDTFARAAAGAYSNSRGSDIKGYCNSQSEIGFTAVPELTEKLIEISSFKYETFDELYSPIFNFLKGYLVK